MSRHNARRSLMDQRSQNQPMMSPWEGGFAPGAGLLPTPANSNLFAGGNNQLQSLASLTSLTSPEAQLAVASNLLSSLLRPVQPLMQTSSQVPSLLAMGNFNRPSNYSNNQRNNYSNNGMSNNQYQSVESRQRVFNPTYRSSAMQQSNRARSLPYGRTGSPSSRNKSADKEVKRDFQSKRRDTSRHEDGSDGPVSYEGIPKDSLNCHVCKKSMWDPQSFENHLKGMAHLKMLEELEKSYAIKAELIRHEAKVEEQQNAIELERLERQGKQRTAHQSKREFCKMCNLAFMGDILLHRKSKAHQCLKNFLHPKCQVCAKDFTLRVDLDKHVLHPDHLKKVLAKGSKKTKSSVPSDSNAAKVEEIVLCDSDVDQSEKEGKSAKDANSETVQQGSGEKLLGKNEGDDVEEAMEGVEVKSLIYDPDVAIGEEFLVPVTGLFCKACRRFFMQDDQALESHCRTLCHFNSSRALLGQGQCESSEGEIESKDTEGSPLKRCLTEDEEKTDVKISKPNELYDPLDESPPTPDEKVVSSEKLSEEVELDLDDFATDDVPTDEKNVSGEVESEFKDEENKISLEDLDELISDLGKEGVEELEVASVPNTSSKRAPSARRGGRARGGNKATRSKAGRRL